MRSMLGRSDPIMRDIKEAARRGHFDRIRDNGLSELAQKSVEDLRDHMSTMSRERRRLYMGSIGYMTLESGGGLSGEKQRRGPTQWLSK